MLANPLVRPRLVAPCSPVADTPARRSRFQASMRRLESGGVVPFVDDSVWAKDAYLAGDDKSRAAALIHALTSSAPLIWAARGGYGAMRILPELEQGLPEANGSQAFLGFSDVTALFPLLNRKGYRCLHGPVVSQVGSLVEGGDAGFEALRRTLISGEGAERIRFRGRVPENEGVIEGRLVGGNLCLCAALAGTEYGPDYQSAILFIEDVGEPAYRLDRYLSQLELAGAFKGLRGVVVGHLGARGEEAKRAVARVSEICSKWLIPMITGLPIGHGNRNACLEYGAQVALRHGAPDESGRGACVLTRIP